MSDQFFTKITPLPYKWEGLTFKQGEYERSFWIILNEYELFKEKIKDSSDPNKKFNHQIEMTIGHYYSVATIMACSWIEATVNFVGVSIVGQNFFERNLEALSIIKKIEILHLITLRELPIEKGNDFRLLKLLIDKRNDLAHPKTEESSTFPERKINNLFLSLDQDFNDTKQAIKGFKNYIHKIQPLCI